MPSGLSRCSLMISGALFFDIFVSSGRISWFCIAKSLVVSVFLFFWKRIWFCIPFLSIRNVPNHLVIRYMIVEGIVGGF